MVIRLKNSKSILIVFFLVLGLAGAAWCADPPEAGGALWTPFAPGCEVTVADALPGVSMAFAWTGADYEKVDTLQPGYGYFLIPENPDVDLQLPDCRLDLLSAQGVSIILHAGWNLLGNPLRDAMTFNDVADASGARAQAFAARAVARSARAVISQGGQAQPGEVVWVYSAQQGAFTLADLVDAAKVKKIQLIPARAHGDTSNVFYIPGAVSFSVSVSYDDGHSETIDPARVQWSVSDENLGRFDAPGVLTSVAPGAVKVTAALANGMSASSDVQLVVECEKVCISAVVAQDKYATVAEYEQFAENLRTQHLGIMPTPKSGCAYMEVSGKRDIKPVKQATLSLIENITGTKADVRAYCRQNFDSGAAAHVLFEADPLGGADRTVWLKDITAQTEWTWDKQDVIKGVTRAGIIQAAALGYANLTAAYRGMTSSPAFVGVDKDRPQSIIAYQYPGAVGYTNWLPQPWMISACTNLTAGLCRNGETSYTRLSVLPLGQSAPLFTRVTNLSGRRYTQPQGVTWSVAPEGIVSVSEDGVITAENVGRASVRAHFSNLVSEPIDVAVDKESIKQLRIGAHIYTGTDGVSKKHLCTLAQNTTIRVHDATQLSFQTIATTSWGRTLILQFDKLAWRITDARGNTVNNMDFSGVAPFDVSVSYGDASLNFKVEQVDVQPVIRVFTQGPFPDFNNPFRLSSRNGIIHVSQPNLLSFTFTANIDNYYTADFTGAAQWSVAGPDGEVTRGLPQLNLSGLYTVSAVYKGRTHSININVYEPGILVAEILRSRSDDRDNKFKAGETFNISILECILPDYVTKGLPQDIESVSSGVVHSRCISANTGSVIDSRFEIEVSDPAMLSYEGSGVVRALSDGIAWVRARKNEIVSNDLQVEVWSPVDNFSTCGLTPNQAEWIDPMTRFTISGNAASRAVVQTDCNTYQKGDKVKVRWFGQIAPDLTHGIVSVQLDLDIRTCGGTRVKTLRCDTCTRVAAKAATDFSGYTTVFDTVDEWDQTDADGKPVGPGCYKAYAVFNILYDPVLEVEFNIK